MRVLVVEDDPALAELISGVLTSAAMLPTLVANGLQAQSLLEQAVRFLRPYDAVVLDLTLPGMDGLDVLKNMRRRKDMTPVLVLTARSTLADRVGGLESGADDYLGKPFEAAELVARLRVITRRSSEERSTNPAVGNLEYDASKGIFKVEDSILVLPPKSHGILQALFRRRGNPVSVEFLSNMDSEGATAESVHTQMSRIRKKLKDAGATVSVRTSRGTGFILEADDAPSGSDDQA